MTVKLIHKDSTQETIFYIIFWILMIVVPMLGVWIYSLVDDRVSLLYKEFWYIWEPLLIMLLVFLVHNYLIAPLLVYQDKTRRYVILLSVLLVIGFSAIVYFKPKPGQKPLPPEMVQNPPRQAGVEPNAILQHGEPTPPPPGQPRKRPLGLQETFTCALLMLLLWGNIGVKIYFKSEEEKKKLNTLQQETLEQKMEYLKYQVNPHFFMNTLNNIHALVDIDPSQAKYSIVELSKMMRYVLYEGTKQTVLLQQAVDFISHYVALMKLRYDDHVEIHSKLPDEIPAIDMPPLLMIPFVENAFKHGVSYVEPSFIDLYLEITDGHIVFKCANSKHTQKNNVGNRQGGVGLANVVKRLELLYGRRYDLQIDDNIKTYSITLTLPKTSPL